jgi:hypothetical protein
MRPRQSMASVNIRLQEEGGSGSLLVLLSGGNGLPYPPQIQQFSQPPKI